MIASATNLKQKARAMSISRINQYECSGRHDRDASASYYYLDSYLKIYQTNSRHPLIGDLVGYIDDDQVFIDGQLVAKLNKHDVKHKNVKEKDYYMNDHSEYFEGLHPHLDLIFKVNKPHH